MSSIDATFHTAQYLIYLLQNTEPENPPTKLGNGLKEALNTLAEIFCKARPP